MKRKNLFFFFFLFEIQFNHTHYFHNQLQKTNPHNHTIKMSLKRINKELSDLGRYV